MGNPARPTIHQRLPEEWGPIVPTPPLEQALLMLVEHELHMKRRFKALSSPIEARNARITREKLIATVVKAYTEERPP